MKKQIHQPPPSAAAVQRDWEFYYDALGQDIHAYILRFGASDMTAGSIVRETFSPDRVAKCDPGRNPTALFKRIARNIFRDRFRKKTILARREQEAAVMALHRRADAVAEPLPSQDELLEPNDVEHECWMRWRVFIWIITRLQDVGEARFNIWWRACILGEPREKMAKELGYKKRNGVDAVVKRVNKVRATLVAEAIKPGSASRKLERELRERHLSPGELSVWERIQSELERRHNLPPAGDDTDESRATARRRRVIAGDLER